MMPPPGPVQLALTSQAKRRYRADRRHLVLHAAAVYKHSARPILQHATLDTIPMMPPPGPVQRTLRVTTSTATKRTLLRAWLAPTTSRTTLLARAPRTPARIATAATQTLRVTTSTAPTSTAPTRTLLRAWLAPTTSRTTLLARAPR